MGKALGWIRELAVITVPFNLGITPPSQPPSWRVWGSPCSQTPPGFLPQQLSSLELPLRDSQKGGGQTCPEQQPMYGQGACRTGPSAPFDAHLGQGLPE